MRRPTPSSEWPESWRLSFHYDRMEVFGEDPRSGYARQYRTRRDHALALVAKVARPGERILDVAAGQGNFSLALVEAGYRVTWNDLRGELVDYVRAKLDGGDVEFRPGDVFDQTFEEHFD